MSKKPLVSRLLARLLVHPGHAQARPVINRILYDRQLGLQYPKIGDLEIMTQVLRIARKAAHRLMPMSCSASYPKALTFVGDPCDALDISIVETLKCPVWHSATLAQSSAELVQLHARASETYCNRSYTLQAMGWQ